MVMAIFIKQLQFTRLTGTDPEINQGGDWLRFQVGSLIYCEQYHSRKI